MTQFKGTPGPWKISGNWVETDDIPIAKIINCKPGSGTYLANKQIIAAAPELLEALTYGQTLNLPDMLDWVADRLVNVHGENCNLDFILSIRERANKARAAINKATGETK